MFIRNTWASITGLLLKINFYAAFLPLVSMQQVITPDLHTFSRTVNLEGADTIGFLKLKLGTVTFL